MTEHKPAPTIQEFAANFRLVLGVDECRDYVIRGKHGDISEYGSGLFSACFCGPAASKTRSRRINAAIRAGIGMLKTRGDDEAHFVFDPAKEAHAMWFIRALGIRQKRQLSEVQKTRLRQLSAAHSPIRRRPQSRASSSELGSARSQAGKTAETGRSPSSSGCCEEENVDSR